MYVWIKCISSALGNGVCMTERIADIFSKCPYSKYVVNQMIVGTHCKCVRPYGNKTDFKCFGFCKRGRIREAPRG